MVEINYAMQISYQDEKAIVIPPELVVDGPDGTKFLRIRSTALPIIQLICGTKVTKNASLASCPALSNLVPMRNSKYDEARDPQDPDIDLFFQGPASPKKKPRRRTFQEDQVLTIAVEDKPIEVLMTGQRPRATDLLVKIDATQLTTVIGYLRQDSHEAMSMEKRMWGTFHFDALGPF